jgi:tRNA modification GTPase
LLACCDLGMHLTAPWRVVLTGRTNVGKSSLINSIAGFQRSIVSQQPGTTRDVVTTTTAIDGWPVELADTAGLRDAESELESAGVELATQTLAGADLVIVVHDVSEPLHDRIDEWVSDILAKASMRPRVIRVLNKIDVLAETHPRPLDFDQHRASALTGEGIAELIAAIGRALVPRAPEPGFAVPFLAEQVAALEAARDGVAANDSAASLAALQPLLACDSVSG